MVTRAEGEEERLLDIDQKGHGPPEVLIEEIEIGYHDEAIVRPPQGFRITANRDGTATMRRIACRPRKLAN